MQDEQILAAGERRLVALLSARNPAPDWPGATVEPVRFGGHLLTERQARQAIAAGAHEIIVHSDTPGTELLRALDRLSRASGKAVTVVADGPALSRRLGAEDRVLLIAERMILPQDRLDDLARASAPALLVTPSGPASAFLERVDAGHVWAGGALLPAGLIFSTVDMLGEWDLVLTLLRRAVQAGASRIELPAELAASGRLARLTDQGDADRLLESLSAGGDEGGQQDLLTALLVPLRRRIVADLARRGTGSGFVGLASAMLSAAAIGLVSLNWPVLALLLALVGEAGLGVARSTARLAMERSPPGWLQVLIKGSSLAVLAVIGGRLTDGALLAMSGVLLPLGWLAVMTYADERSDVMPSVSGRWTRLTGAMALLLVLVAALAGLTIEAFALLGLSAFGTATARLLAGREKRI